MKRLRYSGTQELNNKETFQFKNSSTPILASLITLFILLPYLGLSQEYSDIYQDFNHPPTPSSEYTYIPKKPGHYSIEDWRAVIDSTWGPGLPTQTKLALFDEAWNTLDADYACFQNLNVNWDSLYTLYTIYRSEIESGVSQGRFAAIMNYLGLAFMETHTFIYDQQVSIDTPRDPGVPLFVFGAPGDISHFGAGLSPLPDSSLLVIKTLPNHPLGLAPGDIVLGYDGIPWKNLYKEILNAQLPFSPIWYWVSNENALNHIFLVSAGMNWHLFDTLDVVKYTTGDTVHLPTAPLAGQTGFILGNEQLPVSGVPWLSVGTGTIQWPSQLGDYISWGIVDGTEVGYIYVASLTPDWQPNLSTEFFNAVDSLMHHFDTDGLVLDTRLNYGGIIGTDNQALSLLFNSRVYTVAVDQRGPDPNNHYQMVPYVSAEEMAIPGNPNTFYDRPIAVLTGPGAQSLGDQFALRMKYHPMSRLFGKPTAGAFSLWEGVINLMGNTNWRFAVTIGNSYRVSDPGNYLAHTELAIDEEVWLAQEDVANGEDTVVKAALKWINSMIYAYNMKINSVFIRPAVDTLNITAKVKNPPNHNVAVAAIINTFDSVFVDSLPMYDDGNHGDSLAGDGIYGCLSNTIASEDFYTISSSLTDLDSSHSQYLPNVKRLTTIGPVVLDSIIIYDGYSLGPFYRVPFKIGIRNEGSNATAENIRAYLKTSHPRVAGIDNNSQDFGNIAAGQTVMSPDSFIVLFQNPERIENIIFNIEFYSDNVQWWQDSTDIIVGIKQLEVGVPLSFDLKQNYPNPFNPSTTIEFDLPKTSKATLKVFNILGAEVVTLVSDRLSAGSYSYVWDAGHLASGVYLYRLQAGVYVQTRKIILMK